MSFFTKNMSFSDLCFPGSLVAELSFQKRTCFFSAERYRIEGEFPLQKSMEELNMKRRMLTFILCAGAALLLAACGDDSKPAAKSEAAAEKTAGSVEKTTDYLTGKKPLEQGRKATEKLNKLRTLAEMPTI